MDGQADPERYLRLLLEEALARPGPDQSPLAALRALAAVGLLDDDTTGRLQRDLTLALALRQEGEPASVLSPPPAPATSAPAAAAIPPCMAAVGPATVDLPGASLHVDAVISDGVGTRLVGRLANAGPDDDPTGAGRWETVTIADDAGTTYALTPRADPGPDGFTADLIPPIPTDASWLEIGGGTERPVRMALGESPAEPIEALPHGHSPVDHYLRALVSARLALFLLDGTADRAGATGPAVDALVAAGAVAADAPAALEATRIDEVALGFDSGTGMDPRILAVLEARDRLGRRGVWPLLSAPAVVDGVAVRIDTLAAGPRRLEVLGVCRPWPTPLPVPLSFTATDDVGGWYAGAARATGGDTLTCGLVPPLDPAAGQLTLTVSGPRHALSISLELT